MAVKKITSKALAEALGVSTSTVCESPAVVKHADGSVDVEATMAKSGSLADAVLRKERAQAGLRELELAQKNGELISVDAAASVWAEVGQTVRDGLLSLPERVAPELAALTDARQIRDRLRDEIRKLLANLPEQIHAVAA